MVKLGLALSHAQTRTAPWRRCRSLAVHLTVIESTLAILARWTRPKFDRHCRHHSMISTMRAP